VKPDRASDEMIALFVLHKSQDAVAKLISSPSDYPGIHLRRVCRRLQLHLETTALHSFAAVPNQLPKPQKENLPRPVLIGQEQTKKKLASPSTTTTSAST